MHETLVAPSTYQQAIEREWDRLAKAGTWWTGGARVAMAAAARGARDGAPVEPTEALPAAATEAAARIAAAPATITAAWVDELEARGLDRVAYTEIIGVVARLMAIDTFLVGVGVELPPLPEPRAGEPSRKVVAEAAINGGFVPTVGPASPPNGLSGVADEVDALFDVHGAFYLSLEEMGDFEIVKDLTRPQMELIAARTSLLNDCFF